MMASSREQSPALPIRRMVPPPGVSDVWKWIATTLGGVLLGVVVAGAVSMFQFSILAERLMRHESTEAHPVMAARFAAQQAQIEEMKALLREAIQKMDNYHTQR